MNTATTGYKTWAQLHLTTTAERARRDEIRRLESTRRVLLVMAETITLGASIAPFFLMLFF